MKINWKNLLISIAISLGIGVLGGILSGNSMEVFNTLSKPPLTPPGWIFPIVWTILYVLMGISAYLIYEADVPKEEKESPLSIYGFQLVFNLLWSVVFFNFGNILLAFAILVVLWLLIVAMIKSFSSINTLAAKLQIPYLLWVTFAGYLNLAIYFLNR